MPLDRRKYLDNKELERLRSMSEARAWYAKKHGMRNPAAMSAWMLVDLATSTGLKSIEIGTIHHEHIDLENACMTVFRAKKRRPWPETIPISDSLVEHIIDYTRWKAEVGGYPCGPSDQLLQSRMGPYTLRGLRHTWMAAMRIAGLPHKGLHSGRHAFATRLYGMTHDLRLVQISLGHSRPQTTAIYADCPYDDRKGAINRLFA